MGYHMVGGNRLLTLAPARDHFLQGNSPSVLHPVWMLLHQRRGIVPHSLGSANE